LKQAEIRTNADRAEKVQGKHMKINKLQLVISLVGLTVAGSANAALQMTGGFAAGGDGSYTDSSLALGAVDLIQGQGTGSFAAVPDGGLLTANTTAITGLSGSPLAVSISDFFVFSSAFIGSGTTPANRFDFNLATLSEAPGGVFSGTGTVVDTTGDFANTPATFTLSFGGSASESFSLTAEPSAVPEPSTIISGAAMLLPFGAGAVRKLRNSQKA
jgi:hypothetical protein